MTRFFSNISIDELAEIYIGSEESDFLEEIQAIHPTTDPLTRLRDVNFLVDDIGGKGVVVSRAFSMTGDLVTFSYRILDDATRVMGKPVIDCGWGFIREGKFSFSKSAGETKLGVKDLNATLKDIAAMVAAIKLLGWVPVFSVGSEDGSDSRRFSIYSRLATVFNSQIVGLTDYLDENGNTQNCKESFAPEYVESLFDKNDNFNGYFTFQ